jgi:hypothetical protein
LVVVETATGVGRSFGAPFIGFAVTMSPFRPIIRANQPPRGAAVAGAWREFRTEDDADEPTSGERAALMAFSIFWTVNLWRGERLDDMTLNLAPLAEHLNSTLLSSITSG